MFVILFVCRLFIRGYGWMDGVWLWSCWEQVMLSPKCVGRVFDIGQSASEAKHV